MTTAHVLEAVSIRWYNACADYAVQLARGLTGQGIQVTIAGPAGSPAVAKAAGFGIPVLAHPARKDPVSYFRTVATCRAFALREKVTLVNVHDGVSHMLWALALRGTGIPLVRTSGNQLRPGTHPLARHLVLKKTAGIIATCRTIRRFYAEGFGIPPGNIPIINGGVDTDHYSHGHPHGGLRQRFGLPEDAFVFGILARFSPDKGHETFFRAAGEVASRQKDVWFLVAGWNAQYSRDDIGSMAARAWVLDRTRFFGREGDTLDLIGAVDAGVVASTGSETICRIAMEYMAMAVPVIGSDTNVVPEVVRDGETGIVVPAGDHRALAGAMDILAGSREKARQLGRLGRMIGEREYSLPAFAETTLNAYRTLLHG